MIAFTGLCHAQEIHTTNNAEQNAWVSSGSHSPPTSVLATWLLALNMIMPMGAPNRVRGGSHSGNVAAAGLAAGVLLGILSSDYQASLRVQQVWRQAKRVF
jgi:alpha-D-ribose 1-methylphosphonate 5-triphosphate diphosphatase PhnM